MPNEKYWEKYLKETTPPEEYSYPWKRLVKLTDPVAQDPNLRKFAREGGWGKVRHFLLDTGLTVDHLRGVWIQVDDQNYYLPPDTKELVARVLVIIHGRAQTVTTLVRTWEHGALVELERIT